MKVRVAVGSIKLSIPLFNLRESKAKKSEHCLPAGSIIWIYSPAFTS